MRSALNNQSGLTFTDANLKLLAGDVNINFDDQGIEREQLNKKKEVPNILRVISQCHQSYIAIPRACRAENTRNTAPMLEFAFL